MALDVTFKLQFQGSDGKIYTVDLSNPSHLTWLHQRLGICPLKSKIQELEKRMEEAEKPARKQRILDLLRNQVSGRTEGWIKRRVPQFCYSDLSDLKAENKLVSFRIGNCWKYKMAEGT
jgi:hypothetical protein